MRIALDLSCLAPDKITGIGVYAENLSKALIPIAKARKNKLEAWIGLRKQNKLANVVGRSGLRVNAYNEFNRWWNPPDVFHGPDFKIPQYGSFKKVVTIHDLVEFESEFSNSSFMDDARKKMQKMLLQHKPDHIICISDFTVNRFHHFFPKLGIPVTRIYHGVDHSLNQTVTQNPDTPRPYVSPYILFVGTIETRKNPAALIRAFEIIKSQHRSQLQLVLAGGLGAGHEQILKLALASPEKDSIHIKTKLTQSQLMQFYQHADTFILPTLYEGFGFPVLEAMKMGVPVITSDFGAVHEIAGHAAIGINPRDPKDIAEAYEGMRINSTLKRDLIERGFEQAAKFNWRQTALQTMEVYESVFNRVR